MQVQHLEDPSDDQALAVVGLCHSLDCLAARIYTQFATAADSDALWWPSSPSPGPLPFGDAECLDKAMQRLTIRNLPSFFTPKRD